MAFNNRLRGVMNIALMGYVGVERPEVPWGLLYALAL